MTRLHSRPTHSQLERGDYMLIAWFFGRPFCDTVMALRNNLPNNKDGSECGSFYALSNDEDRPVSTTEAEKP
jgi:hypothetical protein